MTLIPTFLVAQNKDDEEDGEIVHRPNDNTYEEGWTKVKEVSAVDKKAVCKKYEGKYIGYYDQLFKVVNCKRRAVMKDKALMTRNSELEVHLVEANVIAALSVGKNLDTKAKTHRRSCKTLEGKYVTFTFTAIYLVKNCKLREFPDWETFQGHRKKNKTLRDPVLALKSNEFFNMKKGRILSSVIDKVYNDVLSGEAGVDVIPIDEACAGVEGKDVFFYSHIYKIQKCRKRIYDPEAYVWKRNGKVNLKELTSNQWLSLPDGLPMKNISKK